MALLAAASRPTAGWRQRWLAWRDALLASPRFRDAAAAFPLTRPLARRRARELFDLVAGFVYSQVLLACVQLRLFDRLAAGPLTAATLAPRLGLSEDATARLLLAAEPLRLVQRRGNGTWGLGDLGAALHGNPAVVAMIEHHGALYADLRDPVALLRAESTGQPQQGALAGYWPYATAPDGHALAADRVADYSALMAATVPLVAGEVLAAYPVSRHRCLLDVAGGEGAFVQQVARAVPSIELMLFDLPAVADRAAARLQGLGPRCRCTGGDFRSTPLPRGADLVTLVRVLHDHDDATVRALLRAVHEALPPGGTVLVAEPMAGTPGAEAMGGAYFGFYLLAMGRGRPRTAAQLRSLLHEAGFVASRAWPTRQPLQAGVVSARKPGV